MKNKEVCLPLVSIVVITYNSSDYVIETLESVKRQTYKNIELIISDDFSTDDTIATCKAWLIGNKDKFKRVKIIVPEKNTGIPANCNRGLAQSRGDWIKIIAGDDLLLPNCIQKNIQYVKRHSEKIIFSIAEFFADSENERLGNINRKQLNTVPFFFNLNANSQFLHLLIRNYPMNPPTIFFEKQTLEKLGRFNTEYVNEDFPLYLHATFSGLKLGFFPISTVKYRVHKNSISYNQNREQAISEWKKLKMRKTIMKYINWNLFIRHPFVVIEFYNQYLFNELILMTGNKKSFETNLKFLRLLSPLFFLKKIKQL
ncbi:hypothetical protein GCM10023115_48460 [Pontixanthobacter gangjinensis]|uniref:Glycosyltransferase family 2 protein n=1 Tax=Christiangramia aestuarii TaxID=1028746 RepID=A0A7M3SWT3_9FLAO|nr:glycosyltransferase family 2 protein [Christiangramia aestuarii]MUP41064.1 glycosyltransferase family 2 protein [Christiangramia aestuarii]